MDIRLNLIDAGRSTDSEIEDQSDTGTSPLYQAQDLASEPVEGSQIEARNDHIFGELDNFASSFRRCSTPAVAAISRQWNI